MASKESLGPVELLEGYWKSRTYEGKLIWKRRKCAYFYRVYRNVDASIPLMASKKPSFCLLVSPAGCPLSVLPSVPLPSRALEDDDDDDEGAGREGRREIEAKDDDVEEVAPTGTGVVSCGASRFEEGRGREEDDNSEG